MGFCCGGASKTTLQEPRIPSIKKAPSGASAKLDNQLIVYGDYFQSETRTIITVLEYTNCKYSFNPVDVFQGENENEIREMLNEAGFTIIEERIVISDKITEKQAAKFKVPVMYAAFIKKQ